MVPSYEGEMIRRDKGRHRIGVARRKGEKERQREREEEIACITIL